MLDGIALVLSTSVQSGPSVLQSQKLDIPHVPELVRLRRLTHADYHIRA
jgi:hypothetical protein